MSRRSTLSIVAALLFVLPGYGGGFAAAPARAVSSAKAVTPYAFRDSFTRH